MSRQVLSERDVEQFVELGYCVVPQCFTRQTAREVRERWIVEQGFDPEHPEAMDFEVRHASLAQALDAREFAPRAYAAVEDLVGEGRLGKWSWNNFIVNVGLGRDKPWRMPELHEGWHVDGIWFHHFLDSPEQALLTVELYSDVESHGGATVICEGSHAAYARALAEYPEGVDPFEAVELAKSVVPFSELERREVTGEAGTVYLCHPFMLHASSPNVRGVPRFMTNATVILDTPMQFESIERANVVERSIIRALGGPVAYRPSGERRRYAREQYASFNKRVPVKRSVENVGVAS